MTTAVEEFNLDLEPEVLTDKGETKTVPCRQCRRPCVVTRFASASKTECLTCRGQGQSAGLTFNEELETEVLTDREDTKELPCRKCGRRCVVNRSASPPKTECLTCRGKGQATEFEFDDSLEPEILTDKEDTKEVPCVECHRRCVVTRFKTPGSTKCNTCRGMQQHQRREKKKEERAASVSSMNMSRLEHLSDGLINPVFKTIPLCPFDAEHTVELKSVAHTPNYGPRRFTGYEKGMPKYEQDTGESVVYQCNDCKCVISYSTQHPLLMRQNEEVTESNGSRSVLAEVLGERKAA